MKKLLILLTLIVAHGAWSQVPTTISYQSVLFDASGLVVADAAYSMTFRLYDAEMGGVELWSETQSVTTVNGVFSATLGSATPLGLAFDRPYWLGLSVEGGAELSPRVRLTASPYSLMAKSVEDGTVTSAKIADGGIGTGDLADDAVTSAKIADGTVGTGDVADGAITTDKIADGTVSPGDLASGAAVKSVNGLTDAVTLAAGSNVAIASSGNTLTISATGTELPDGAVTSAKVADGAVTSAKIVDGAVAAVDVADNAITTAKIVDGTVSSADLASGAAVKSVNGLTDAVMLAAGSNVTVTSSGNTLTISATGTELPDGAVTGAKIADGTIADADISSSAGISTSKISGLGSAATLSAGTAAGSVVQLDGSARLPAVDGSQLTGLSATPTDGSVTNAKLAADAVTSAKIADGTVAAVDLADGSVTSAKIADGTIGAGDLADGAVTSAKIADGTIAAGDLASSAAVKSVNGLTDAVTLAAGSNVTITPSGNTLTLAAADGNSLDAAYDQGGSGSGRTITADNGAVAIGGTDGLVVTGTAGTGTIPVEGAGTRLMFYPNKSAFRAGYVSGTQWDDASIGNSSTVGGGSDNTASGPDAVIGGGGNNTAGADAATIAGGSNNTANGWGSTIGGGDQHSASGSGATVAGGRSNSATGSRSTVGGGYQNAASGEYAAVPGGINNTAAGDYSFAAGRRAKANHDGAFVWADTTDADFTSTAIHQFLIRASGGVGIGTASPGAQLTVNQAAASDVVDIQDGGTTVMKIYDGGIVDLPKQSACRAYRDCGSGLQSIPNATWTKVQLDAESYDIQNEFDSTTNYRFTAQKAGIYSVKAKLRYYTAAGSNSYGIGIYKNGGLYSQYRRSHSIDDNLAYVTITEDVQLGAGQYIEIFAYQSSGGALDITVCSDDCVVAIHKIQ